MHDQNKCRAGEKKSKCVRSLERPFFLSEYLSPACLYTWLNLFLMEKKHNNDYYFIYFILFYFILFYFILFILFYFILFYL